MDTLRAASHPPARGASLRARQIAARGLARLALYLGLSVGAVVFGLPMLWLVLTSVKPSPEIFLFPPSLFPSRVEWHPYGSALAEFPFLQGLRNTMIIVVSVEVGHLFSIPLAAYAFARLRFPLRNPLFVVVLATMMVPAYVLLIPQFLLFRNLGWLNTFYPLTVPAFAATNAFFIFMLRQFFLGVPREYDDAAEIDGCSPLGTYWRILLPLVKPALGAVAILTYMSAWNDVFGPLIYLTTQDRYTLALSFRLTQLSIESGLGVKPQPYNFLMAVATLITIPPILVFFLTQRYFIQGVVISGLKG
jgi:multiple sugar transport system permease protein